MPMPQADVNNTHFPITNIPTCKLTLAAALRIREVAMAAGDIDRAITADRRIDNLLGILSRLTDMSPDVTP